MTTERQPTATGVLESVSDRLRDRLDRERIPLSEVSVGTHLLLVVADEGRLAGLAHRPSVPVPAVDPEDRDALELASWAVEPPAEGEEVIGQRALGVAALNALSDLYVDWRRGDPMASLSADVDVVATVGFFRPAVKRFGPVDLRVVERDPMDESEIEIPAGGSLRTYLPEEAEEAFRGADVLFLTGSAFVYGGAGRYLALAEDGTTVVVIGSTSSFLPGPVFAAGADVLAGTRVTDAEAVSDSLREEVCTTDLYGSGLEKVYVAAETGDGLAFEDPTV